MTATALVAAGLLLASCGADESCDPAAATDPEPTACADLDFRGTMYDEWRAVDAPEPQVMQELGNATYPDCNVEDGCAGDLEGFGATDVWLLGGVDPTDALIGLREGTDTFVIFVRVGVDPDDLEPLAEPTFLS